MKSRNKIILVIIAVWAMLITLVLVASKSLFTLDFEKLERDLAADNANRVFQVSLSGLNYIYLQNLDIAHWDDAYDFMHKKNKKFIEENFRTEFYVDNKINVIIIINNKGDVVWSNGFNLYAKSDEAVPPEVLRFFQLNATAMLANKKKYYEVTAKPDGVSGFLAWPPNYIGYFTLNTIKDSSGLKAPAGIIVFGKTLTSVYLNKLSHDLGYSVQLLSLSHQTEVKQSVVTELAASDKVYTNARNQDELLSYKLLKDFTNKPIALFRVEQSRKIYNESKRSALRGQVILFAFSLLGVLAMSVLVYLFFRKQDLLTKSFERFVPHPIIELLRKKDILEVKLGDHSKRKLSVLFMDIRNFTTISENLSSQASFDFINTLLKKIAPVVAKENGIIDKYIGDAVMAIFPKEDTSADDAVKAANMILKEVDKLNADKAFDVGQEIKVGIGINTGEAMLGIIGAEGRLECTVISDMVNTASRIQELTRTYACDILITDSCFNALKNPEYYVIQHVADVLVKGKTIETSVYSVG